MGSFWKDLTAAVCMGMILPGILLNLAVAYQNWQEPRKEETTGETAKVSLPVLVKAEEGTVQADMDDYLVGVVLAEMPASFETEALKAQAVVARTYSRKAYITGGKHGDGSVCLSPSCCQGYLAEADYLSRGGTEEGLEKVRSAVAATSGEVLTYEGGLIEATYFSCSGGSTEDAAAVWGTDYPYLQAVSSPGEEAAAYYSDTVQFTAEAFQNALGVVLPESTEDWFGSVVYTEGGGVASMRIGEQQYSGTRLRSLLGLRSTAFTVTAEEDTITVTTRGYGHRVGMSQYGADAMALQGSGYSEILSHYYPGTALTAMES